MRTAAVGFNPDFPETLHRSGQNINFKSSRLPAFGAGLEELIILRRCDWIIAKLLNCVGQRLELCRVCQQFGLQEKIEIVIL